MIINSGEVELLAAGTGPVLRTIRRQWRLSLREVEERSLRIARERGDTSFQVSASWLDRLERNENELTVNKLISLAQIYSIPTDQPIRPVYSENARTRVLDQRPSANLTILATEGIQDSQTKRFRLDPPVSDRSPDETTLLPAKNGRILARYRRGIIGKLDLSLDPMIPAGSVVKIDTRKREISSKKDWTHEFERPIYFLTTREGYVCGWCELDKTSEWLTLIPHPLSPVSSRRWKYHGEIESVGLVVAVTIRL
jgi:transcriptional regulator with XRE-family HTH domain